MSNTSPHRDSIDLAALRQRYHKLRAATLALCEPLAIEDYVVQSMPSASPIKWHLAHTTWFFETFVLATTTGHRPFAPDFEYLFNSYYNTVGAQFPRDRRGLISRPTVAEVTSYREHVDARIGQLLAIDDHQARLLAPLIEVGIHHEQQHQELMLTDLLHLFSVNPTYPVYGARHIEAPRKAAPVRWLQFPGGVVEIGHDGHGFAFDNERPRHRTLLDEFELASRPVTNGEFLNFINDGGYRRPDLWLSDGWTSVHRDGWEAPSYWQRREDEWLHMTLSGLRPVDPEEPVAHISFYEADAYARYAGARLPTEQEWEVAAATIALGDDGQALAGNLVEDARYHPCAGGDGDGPQQMFGDVWEWTASPYVAYPGYQQPAGAFGEYNGKFMCNQMVLRGGSCATPRSHIRATYRNFFQPETRWQFSGLRLARSSP